MEKLAIHGGTPASERLLGYGRQSIDEDDVSCGRGRARKRLFDLRTRH